MLVYQRVTSFIHTHCFVHWATKQILLSHCDWTTEWPAGKIVDGHADYFLTIHWNIVSFQFAVWLKMMIFTRDVNQKIEKWPKEVIRLSINILIITIQSTSFFRVFFFRWVYHDLSWTMIYHPKVEPWVHHDITWFTIISNHPCKLPMRDPWTNERWTLRGRRCRQIRQMARLTRRRWRTDDVPIGMDVTIVVIYPAW